MSNFNFYPFNLPPEKYELIKYKNRAISRAREGELRHFCGYVVFRKKDIPKDWWGNYDAPGLQYLNVHGGLTYCEIEGATDQEKYEEEYRRKLKALSEEDLPSPTNFEEVSKYFDRRKEIRAEYVANLSKDEVGYVVFGFDCAHYADRNNASLQDPNHVMMLTEQMEFQMLKFRDQYENYRDAHPSVRDITRETIITNVRREADIQCELGFGAMIEKLRGED